MLKILSLIIVAFITVNCASNNNKTLDDNNRKQIAAMITKGVTTKDDITASFGKALKVTKDKQGQEVWTYEDDRTSLNPLNIIPVTRTLLGTSGREKKIVITFNGNIVADYVFTNRDVQTGKSIFGKIKSATESSSDSSK